MMNDERKTRSTKFEIAVFQTNPNDQKINDRNKNRRLRRQKLEKVRK